jgi:hypothetical protein
MEITPHPSCPFFSLAIHSFVFFVFFPFFIIVVSRWEEWEGRCFAIWKQRVVKGRTI